MSTASFAIGCVAFVLSSFSVGWQVFTWRHGRRFDVRVRIQPEPVVLGGRVYEIVVVVENHGATPEALQEVSVLFAHDEVGDDSPFFQSGSFWDRKATGELPPRRNLRFTYDLLGGRFMPFPDGRDVGVGGDRALGVVPHRREVARGGDDGATASDGCG